MDGVYLFRLSVTVRVLCSSYFAVRFCGVLCSACAVTLCQAEHLYFFREGGVYDNIVFRNPDGWDPAQLVKDADQGKLNRLNSR